MKDKNRPGRSQFKVGLRGQQVVLFLLVSLMPLFIVAVTIKFLGENALKESVGENLVLLAQEKLARADNAISEKIEKIQAELPNIQAAVVYSNTANDKQSVFLSVWARLEDSIRLLETYAGYKTEVTITNAFGYVLRSNNQQLDYDTAKMFPHRMQDRDWWQRAYNNGIGYPFLEDVIYDEVRGVHFLPIALPIRAATKGSVTQRNANTVGVLRTFLFLPELTGLVQSLPELAETYTILTSSSGRIIAASPQSEYRIDSYIEMSNAAEEAIIEAKIGINGKYYDYEPDGETDTFGEPRIYGWARTQLSSMEPWKVQQNFSNWIVFTSRPISSAYAGVGRLNRYIFYVTIGSSCIVILIAWGAAQRIATPILKVAQAARSIGQGEFDSEIRIDSDNEVGVLAEEFNEMRRNLKNAVDRLTQEEKKLTAIVDNLGEGLIVVEPTGRVLYVNPVAERLLNLGNTTDYENFIAVDTANSTICWTRTLEKGRDTETAKRIVDMKILSFSRREVAQHQTMVVEVNIDGNRQDNDNSRVLRIIASNFSDEHNNIVGTVYVFDDITDEHEIEKMKSEFVSLVSHELRTPLTSIIGFISLILEGKTGKINQKQYESLSHAQRQSKRLAALINDLLDISRIEAGRIEMKQERVQIDRVARRRIEELRPQADQKAISLLFERQPNLPPMVGDADRIRQVFINLIGNAIKFTPDNGKVTVRISKSQQNGGATDGFHVQIIDTGPGIPPEDREKVFDKFRQLGSVHHARKPQSGTGLGLSIAAGIVEAHGGRLWVDSGDNGFGCNFQFFMPLEKGENG